MKTCNFSGLPGTAETLLRWGEKVNHGMMVYFLSSNSAKNHQICCAYPSYSKAKMRHLFGTPCK